LIHYYKFSITSGGPIASHGSCILSTDGIEFDNSGIQTLQLLQAPFIQSPSQSSGPELRYVQHNVRFYQVWAVSLRLGLSSTLAAICPENENCESFTVSAPTYNAPASRRYKTHQSIGDAFIVPDGVGDNDLESSISRLDQLSLAGAHTQDDIRLRINWRVVFQQIFGEGPIVSRSAAPFKTMTGLLDDIREHIKQAKEESSLPKTTL
jgi:RNA polymerase I-specific transcription initiation factor RRN6